MGRPSIYSDELAERMCDMIANGETLSSVCRKKGMPDRTTVLRWMEKDSAFATKCARARVLSADVREAEIADLEAKTLSGKLDPQVARVVLSSKQWRASKSDPSRYGDRQAVDVSGHLDLRKLSDDELAAEVETLAAIVSGGDGAG